MQYSSLLVLYFLCVGRLNLFLRVIFPSLLFASVSWVVGSGDERLVFTKSVFNFWDDIVGNMRQLILRKLNELTSFTG